jgi:hypothetical protein
VYLIKKYILFLKPSDRGKGHIFMAVFRPGAESSLGMESYKRESNAYMPYTSLHVVKSSYNIKTILIFLG